MNISLCFYGLSCGTNDKNDKVTYKDALNSIKKYIIEPNNKINNKCDIFFHTWEHNTLNVDTILNDYKPIKHKIDKRIKFDNNIIWNSYSSRWYSHGEVLKLKKEYENENNFKYDYVMLIRFDCIFKTEILFNFSNEYIYSAIWYDDNLPESVKKTHLLEYWFILNSKNADLFSNIYDKLNIYRNKYGDISTHRLPKLHLEEEKIDDKIRFVFAEYCHFTLERFKERKLEQKYNNLLLENKTFSTLKF